MNIIIQLAWMKSLLPQDYEIDIELSTMGNALNVYATHTSEIRVPLVWKEDQWEST